jgi:protein-S-isoprenylcysteine O-methyltransferase Ste14
MNNMSQDVFNWIWIGFFVVIVVVRKTHERKAGRRSSLKDTPAAEGTLMMLWGIASGILPFIYIFSSWLDFANFPYEISPVFGIIGVVFFFISIWMLHRSHADLGKLWSPTVDPEAKQKLVTDGVYKRIRHPMYAAHMLWGVAQVLLLPNYIAGQLALVLMLAVIVLRVPREEQAMLEEFGDEYRQYMQKTGRILPKFSE